MTDLITTNVRFSSEDYLLIKDQATKKKISFAEYVRQSVQMRLKPKKVERKTRSIWDIAKYTISAKGLTDADFVNEAIDEVIYGDPHGQKR